MKDFWWIIGSLIGVLVFVNYLPSIIVLLMSKKSKGKQYLKECIAQSVVNVEALPEQFLDDVVSDAYDFAYNYVYTSKEEQWNSFIVMLEKSAATIILVLAVYRRWGKSYEDIPADEELLSHVLKRMQTYGLR